VLGEYLGGLFPDARVLMSECGEAGLELARRTGPRVVLLDLGSGGMHRFELAERLQCSDPAGGVAIVALTDDMSADTLISAEAAGFSAFLRKPADMNRLEAVLRPLLEGGAQVGQGSDGEARAWNRSRDESPS
jgi:DNA-binding NarL/FixJ family response regulator